MSETKEEGSGEVTGTVESEGIMSETKEERRHWLENLFLWVILMLFVGGAGGFVVGMRMVDWDPYELGEILMVFALVIFGAPIGAGVGVLGFAADTVWRLGVAAKLIAAFVFLILAVVVPAEFFLSILY